MEDRETAQMRKYGESKTTQIMMATVPHVTSGLGLRKFQADRFLLTRVYMYLIQLLLTLRIPVRLMTPASLYSNNQPTQQHIFFFQFCHTVVFGNCG